MKLRLPRKSAPAQQQQQQPVTIVVKPQEGCFLRTLNCGCCVFVFAAIIIGLLAVWLPHLIS